MPQLISANRLTDGLVVFRTADGGWSQSVADAAFFDGEEAAEAAMVAARADVAANLVVDLEPVEAILRSGGFEAVHLRDRIRIAGPSVLQPKAEPAHRSPAHNEQPDVSI